MSLVKHIVSDKFETLRVLVLPAGTPVEGAKVPQIFVFNNTWIPGQPVHDWNRMYAMSEDGEVLAGHLSSSPGFGVQDMGLLPGVSEWKHDLYEAKYPNGYDLVYMPDVKTPEGEHAEKLLLAFKLNEQKAVAAEREKASQ